MFDVFLLVVFLTEVFFLIYNENKNTFCNDLRSVFIIFNAKIKNFKY